jgi:hypothetical protein
MKKKGPVLLIFLFLISCCIWAENISDKIRLNGFLSQGFIYTTDNTFIPNSEKNGSFEISELGLAFSVDITDKLHFGVQFLARDMGPVGNYDVKLDWGFADYSFADAFGLRFGRIKTPIGLYNETRDIDALRAMALLPQGVYDELMRPVFVAYNGIALYGLLDMGGVGSLDYHLFYGTLQHPNDAPYILQIKDAINLVINKMGLNLSDMTMESELFYGGRVIWNTPLKGLRLAGTYIYHNAKIQSNLNNIMPWADIHPFLTLPATGHMELTNCFFLSGELAVGDLTLTGEYMELLPYITMNMFGEETVMGDETMQGWYVMLSYMLGDQWTFTALYDVFYEKKGDTKGDNAVFEGNPRIVGWQKDLAFGIRLDVNFNWTIKMEWHFMDGLAKSFAYSDLTGEPKQYWNMFITKVSFNF